MPAPAGSYSLSAALRALGIRDPRVIPELSADRIQPVINFGSIETFTAEVIEARGIAYVELPAPGVTNSVLVKMLSVAPGGTVIEQLLISPRGAAGGSFIILSSPTEPSGGTLLNLSPWTIGGQALSNLFRRSPVFFGGLPIPPGASFIGGTFPYPIIGTADVFGRLWVPPSWWFAVSVHETPDVTSVLLRFREIPQAQGAA